jgi:diadenosine tetraphosphate (Ap4A) HIT family hydrolase
MHVHFHIIPKMPDGRGLGIGWDRIAFDHGAGAELAKKIAAAV